MLNKITLTNKFLGVDVNKYWGDKETRNWKSTIKYNGKQFTIPFHQGMGYNTDPTIEDIMYCIITDASYYENESYEEFCDGFGYNMKDKKVQQMYKSFERFSKTLNRMFTDEEIEEMRKELEEY